MNLNSAYSSKVLSFAPRVPFEFARDYLLLPFEEDQDEQGNPVMNCLCVKGVPTPAVDNLSMLLDLPIQLVVKPEPQVQEAIRSTYQTQMAQSDALRQASSDGAEAEREKAPPLEIEKEFNRLTDRDLLASGDKAPVARLVDALLFDALSRKASDLHVHPYPAHQGSGARLVIRYRVDGVLFDAYTPDPRIHDQLVGRIKVLAGMDVAEKRLPQDGRTSVTVGGMGGAGKVGRQIDLRVSTLPTTCGERVVVRLLEQTEKLKALSELGMPADIEAAFQEAIRRSHGLILVTGPTGSGKTTTIYSALAQLDSTRLNILTLEDPVEYQLQGISQTQIATKKGMTFASSLRHVLRQDPDVILVGEVRDEPTARMVIQSSMTGHLVLTTLHTNNAASAVARLADLGVEPYLIASSVIGVLAQRLVRRPCPSCHGAMPADPSTAGIGRCDVCGGTGYSGRTGLYEWFSVTGEIREQILASAGAEALEAVAGAQGMRTLWQQGQAMVAEARTTQAELYRVLGTSPPDE